MPTTPIPKRLAECWARQRRCDVASCGKLARRWGRYCRTHDMANFRTGHPEGRAILLRDVRPYLKLTTRYIREHREHPTIRQALAWCARLLHSPRVRVAWLAVDTTPERRLARWLDSMEDAGVTAEKLLGVITAMYLIQEVEPRAFRSDRHFRFQLAFRVLRTAPSSRSEMWAGGKRCFKSDPITVGLKEYLADRIERGAGVAAIQVARVISGWLVPTQQKQH